jgi:hypothetical protein
MDIETVVRTAKIVQATSFFAIVGVAAYAAHQQRKLNTTIANTQADINRVNEGMTRVYQAVTKL